MDESAIPFKGIVICGEGDDHPGVCLLPKGHEPKGHEPTGHDCVPLVIFALEFQKRSAAPPAAREGR